MIKLSKMTDYAVVSLCKLSRKKEELMSAPNLSKETGLTLITAQKLFKLLISISGFFKINPSTIHSNILNTYFSDISGKNSTEVLDSPVNLTSCVYKSEGSCEANDIYFFGRKWNKINKIKSLNNVYLKNLLNYENLSLIDDDKAILIDIIN